MVSNRNKRRKINRLAFVANGCSREVPRSAHAAFALGSDESLPISFDQTNAWAAGHRMQQRGHLLYGQQLSSRKPLLQTF